MSLLIHRRNTLLTEILGLVIRINEKRKHTVMMRLSGHVGGLDIQVHRNGWQHDTEWRQLDCHGCFTSQLYPREVTAFHIEELASIRNELTELLEDSYNEQHAVNS